MLRIKNILLNLDQVIKGLKNMDKRDKLNILVGWDKSINGFDLVEKKTVRMELVKNQED